MRIYSLHRHELLGCSPGAATEILTPYHLLTTTMPLIDEYKVYCSYFASTPTTSALHRIGARMPQEVLGRILISIHYDYFWALEKEKKHSAGQLALTCRYWATKCQATIFEIIKLRSGKDVDELLSLMASPLSRIASYIKTLILNEYDRPSSPWLHLVSLRLVPRLSLDPDWSIYLFLYDAAGTRSIHDGLPRSYPSFSSHISQFYL